MGKKGTSEMDVVLGKALAKARARAGMSQGRLADAAGVSIGYISYLECGRKHASLAVYQRIFAALKHELVLRIGVEIRAEARAIKEAA